MKRRRSQNTDATRGGAPRVATLQLTAVGFTDFYRTVMGLRFPLPVDEVLELRSLLNHAVDRYRAPALTPDVRQFREALEQAIGSFGIDKPHHRERLLKTLCLLRDVHVAHSIASRDQELTLRARLADNRRAHTRAVREGLLSVFLLVMATLLWVGLPAAHWLLLAAAVLSAYTSWHRFHALPGLEEDAELLRQQINAVLRLRVKSVNWKMLIHKLALILGFKQIRGIEVFRIDHHDEPHGAHRTYH